MERCTKVPYTTRNSAKKFAKGDKELQTLFENVCDEFFKGLSEEIMKGYTYKLPMRLGYIGLRKTKAKAPDWGKSADLDKRIIHKNFHTDGYVYKWFWYHRGTEAIFINNAIYTFIPTRTNKRTLGAILKTTFVDVPVTLLGRGERIKQR